MVNATDQRWRTTNRLGNPTCGALNWRMLLDRPILNLIGQWWGDYIGWLINLARCKG
jgi:hypothetical protein